MQAYDKQGLSALVHKKNQTMNSSQNTSKSSLLSAKVISLSQAALISGGARLTARLNPMRGGGVLPDKKSFL
ncbi:hypothetical protein [Pseudoalteromonas denitrificans]|uniref:Uncharacterized protein n=1 Tax=Pseudoalteromonas denitrificans DSM 6059 TaxID=1123010 RepID=A0A1I1L5C8_9GAMM|nr:hypothetical protein [Pseudoalteromonas denitrificans]SFC68229.1 hypothetical protein SAMN02745724_02261 [Pseudoalteromonas denitrificans DSM 6059]